MNLGYIEVDCPRCGQTVQMPIGAKRVKGSVIEVFADADATDHECVT